MSGIPTIADMITMSVQDSMLNQTATTPPSAPTTVTATARSLGILVQWSSSAGAEGYNISVADSANMSSLLTQVKVLGENSVEYFYNTGHTATTRYFTVQAYKGNLYSGYSSVASAATTKAQATSTFPTNVTFTDTETDLASLTLTTTGGTLLVIGNASLNSSVIRNAKLKLYEDAGSVAQVNVTTYSTTGTYALQSTIFQFRNPAAGSHTYKMTAQNMSDANNCFAKIVQFLVVEILLVTVAGSVPAVSTVTPAADQSYVPRGSEQYYR